jgi:hypothetical protein
MLPEMNRGKELMQFVRHDEVVDDGGSCRKEEERGREKF